MPSALAKSNSFVRIHAHIADGGTMKSDYQGHCSVMLWYLLRAWDRDGCGVVKFNVEDAAKALDRSVPSIRRYLRQGRQLGFFRSVAQQGSTIKVFYRSLFKVCQNFELDTWGAVAEIEISDLNNLKLIATQIEAQRSQEQSRHNALREHHNVLTVDELLTSSQSSRGATGVIHRGARCLFVDEKIAAFGVSQVAIAHQLGRSDRTIRKRLSNSYRLDHGLPSLDRVQLAQTSSELNQDFGTLFKECDRTEIKEIDGIWKTELNDRIFSSCGRVFKSLCNIYSKDLTLISMRRSRSVFKKMNRLVDGCNIQAPIKLGSVNKIEKKNPETTRVRSSVGS